MNYEIRDFKSKDIFPMAKIISKIGVKEFKQCFESDSVRAMIKGGDVNAIGVAIALDMGGVIISHLPDAEKEIYAFLSNMTGLKQKELEDCGLAEFAEMIIGIFKKEDFVDFISVVSKLFK